MAAADDGLMAASPDGPVQQLVDVRAVRFKERQQQPADRVLSNVVDGKMTTQRSP